MAAHAEGLNTTAAGNYTHVEGYSSVARGNVAHAEGYDNTANGEASHAEGYSTTVTECTTPRDTCSARNTDPERTSASRATDIKT